MAKIVVFGSQKGGVGKTTFSINFATFLLYLGYKVLLLDTDTQGSSSLWAEDRAVSELPSIPVLSVTGKNFEAQIKNFSESYDYIIVDPVGADSRELRYSMILADLAIFPMPIKNFDIKTLRKVNDEIVGHAMPSNPKLKAYLAPNMISTNPAKGASLLNSVKEYVENPDYEINNVKLMKSHLRVSDPFSDSTDDGSSVFEYLSRGEHVLIGPNAESQLDGISENQKKRYRPVLEMNAVCQEIVEILS